MKKLVLAFLTVVFIFLGLVVPRRVEASSSTIVYRIVSPTGINLFTIQPTERDTLLAAGWKLLPSSFAAWGSVVNSSIFPVYRLHNSQTFFYSISQTEISYLKSVGYSLDGLAFYISGNSTDLPVYRLHKNGVYFYTASTGERDSAVSNGYINDGVAFFADPLTTPTPSPTPIPTLTPPVSIEFGKVQTVYSNSLQGCNANDIPDFPARALVDADGNVQMYTSATENRKFIGPNLTDVKHDCHIIYSSPANPDPRSYDTYDWLTSPYTLDGINIYSLVHTEYHGDAFGNCNTYTLNPFNCWWNSINLAKSTDKGYSFTHLTPPNQNISNTSVDFNPNNTLGHTGIFQPSNILAKDGYYYAKATVILPSTTFIAGICVMRTNNLDDPSSWNYWDGTGFNVPARGIPASGSCRPIFQTDWDWHWNNYLNSYTVVGAMPDYQGIIQSTSDLVSVSSQFKFPYLPNRYSVYYTFLQPGAESRNFEDIGRSPWMYYVTCGDDKTTCTSFTDNNRDLKRVRVRFNKSTDIGKYDILNLGFNEYKGTKTLDASFYGNDGTLSTGAVLKQEGATKFVNFNGAGSVTVPNDPSLNVSGDVSIDAKVRTLQIPPSGIYPAIAQKADSLGNRNYGLFLAPSGQLIFSFTNAVNKYQSGVSKKAINDGAWHDVLATYSNVTNTTNIYIDGALDNTTTQTGPISGGINSGNVTVGNGFTGDVDALTVYNYVYSTPQPTSAPLLGDVNGDGKVDLTDLNIVKTNFGNPYTIYDYTNVMANFGK